MLDAPMPPVPGVSIPIPQPDETKFRAPSLFPDVTSYVAHKATLPHQSRYRHMLGIQQDKVKKLQEFYYEEATHSFQQEQVAAGST